MRDDDDKGKPFFCYTPSAKSMWMKSILDEMPISGDFTEPVWLGVDWAKDSGYNRGDIISKKGNVIEVRFKTVTLK